jgi:hypothetical protein
VGLKGGSIGRDPNVAIMVITARGRRDRRKHLEAGRAEVMKKV